MSLPPLSRHESDFVIYIHSDSTYVAPKKRCQNFNVTECLQGSTCMATRVARYTVPYIHCAIANEAPLKVASSLVLKESPPV